MPTATFTWQSGDEHGISLDAGNVTTAPGWPDAYKRWTDGGWNAVSGPEAFGGQACRLPSNLIKAQTRATVLTED